MSHRLGLQYNLYMDALPEAVPVAGLFLATYLLNLPFGYLRRRTRRFSLLWFLYIHLPVPFVFLARVLSHLDLRYVPLFLFAAVMGQLSGGRLEF